MSEPELTDATIAEAMERAAAAVCPPLDDRCYGLSFGAAEALAKRSPKGWCLIGWVVWDSGRQAWDAWYNVFTKEGRLRRQPDTK
jgi:hypothetical protein